MLPLPEDAVVEIVQGGKGVFEIALVNELDRPIDTTDYDQFRICIKLSTGIYVLDQNGSAEGSTIVKLGSPVLGVFKVNIVPDDTLNFRVADRQDIHFEMSSSTDADDVIALLFKDRLNVLARICT